MTVYEMMTERIISQLERGTVPWQKPWNSTTGIPRNLQSGKPYRGINLFMLGCAGFSSPYWLTFK
ncbi:MAG: ArdC-like ssDNA-binding domain-containing protein, partial [Nitrospiria bacterium]